MDYLAENWLGLTGLVSGVLCVWLLIRENILTFPIGLVYAVISVVVMARNQLYADTLLNGYYVLMNAYGWYFWLRGSDAQRAEHHQESQLPPGWVPAAQWPILGLIVVAGTALMGWYFDTRTDAAFAYPDSFTTVASFVAMWMSARKYLESWILWFVIDVVAIGLYLVKAADDAQLYFYAVLYTVYLGMAIMGWIAWRKHVVPHPQAA